MGIDALVASLGSDACTASKELFELKKKEVRRYTLLAFLLALAVVVVAVVAIVALLVSKEYGLGIMSALGTVVGGAAWLAIFKARSDALKDADKFLNQIATHCGPEVAATFSL